MREVGTGAEAIQHEDGAQTRDSREGATAMELGQTSPRTPYRKGSRNRTTSSERTENIAPVTPKSRFAPLPDASRRAFAQETSSQEHGQGQPSSGDSLPLQQMHPQGRQSALEFDLADHGLEPISAADVTQQSLHERARRRKRRRRRTTSVGSRQTRRTVRSRAGDALRAIRTRTRRGSSSSSCTSNSSSSHSSGSSSDSGINWRFWRSSSASDTSVDSYVPPEPIFTLYTPHLANPLEPALSSEQDLEELGKSSTIPHPYTTKSAEKREQGLPSMLGAPQVFDTLLSTALTPCLDKLRHFWTDRDQEDGLGGDVGAAHTHRAPQTQASKGRKPTIIPAQRRTRDAGPAWWLDVQCPSAADMRQLRRVSRLSKIRCWLCNLMAAQPAHTLASSHHRRHLISGNPRKDRDPRKARILFYGLSCFGRNIFSLHRRLVILS